jgi:hypothetical protein
LGDFGSFFPGGSKKRDRNLYIHPLFQILSKSFPYAKKCNSLGMDGCHNKPLPLPYEKNKKSKKPYGSLRISKNSNGLRMGCRSNFQSWSEVKNKDRSKVTKNRKGINHKESQRNKKTKGEKRQVPSVNLQSELSQRNCLKEKGNPKGRRKVLTKKKKAFS